ncbi:MAG: NADPH-dependent oxidoreductase [Labilithrix sp.]|nr:NADPH-dependent oxidoreductase [Labilithrix sp.]
MSIRVVGLGGTHRPQSSTEQALRIALAACAELGAETSLLGADALDLPMYRPGPPGQELAAAPARLLGEVRGADALIIASPGYHGAISGLVKNALDWLEETRTDARPYLDGMAVGCIATGGGWQATMTTMTSLRDVVHALRGWPTPLGAAINTTEATFAPGGPCSVPAMHEQLRMVGQQVMKFTQRGHAR